MQAQRDPTNAFYFLLVYSSSSSAAFLATFRFLFALEDGKDETSPSFSSSGNARYRDLWKMKER